MIWQFVFEDRIMFLAGIVFEITCDTNPVEPGFQPSAAYIALCLIIPIVVGVFAGIISTVFIRFVEKRFPAMKVSNDH